MRSKRTSRYREQHIDDDEEEEEEKKPVIIASIFKT